MYFIDISPDGFQVLVQHGETIHAQNVRYGDALSEIDSIPCSMHDHVHVVWERCGRNWSAGGAGVHSRRMESIGSPKVIAGWAVEEREARRLIHIPAEYGYIYEIKVYSSYVAIGCDSGLLVLDTGRNPEVM